MREFRSKGIKAVKMDDIANILSVSKRTMYETFENKEHLLMESVKAEYDGFDRHMQAFASEKERHVIDFILETYRLHMESLKDTVPNYYADLRKYPEVLAWMEERHNEFQERTCRFFEEGVRQGYFRQDVNYELIYRVTTGSLILYHGKPNVQTIRFEANISRHCNALFPWTLYQEGYNRT